MNAIFVTSESTHDASPLFQCLPREYRPECTSKCLVELKKLFLGRVRAPTLVSDIEGVVVAAISLLPGPVADLWQWQLSGSCRRENPDVFFHPEGERGPARRNRDFAAKTVCMACPVLERCRDHALHVREPYGVWGAMTECEREAANGPSPGFPAAS